MDDLPALAPPLSVVEKDALIRTLFAQVRMLTAKVAELEGRLAQNSRNSSKPPSSDGLHKLKPKSLRVPNQHSRGGQLGHAGHTLKKVSTPDHVVEHRPPSECVVCGRALGPATLEIISAATRNIEKDMCTAVNLK